METPSLVVESHSSRETRGWGRRLASRLTGGELIALSGDLGVGKTCFVKGLARGLDLSEDRILSPTFTMIQEHHGRLALFHIDLYRLDHVAIDDLGLREYLFSDGVAAVEWFERLREADDLDRVAVSIAFAGASNRRIEFAAVGDRYALLIDELKREFA
jgi:tRNA threonylcarbamoyladenosine biosynthesis protein TsaE